MFLQRFATWLIAKITTRDPDVVIGRAGDTYLLRWWIIPRNRFFNLYLHKFLRSDDDRALHDHPWMNCSFVLGLDTSIRLGLPCDIGYTEVVPRDKRKPNGPVKRIDRPAGSVTIRGKLNAHRIELPLCPIEGTPLAVWSLFITGPVRRKWGFWCSWGWRPFDEFVDNTKTEQGHLTSKVGRGCD